MFDTSSPLPADDAVGGGRIRRGDLSISGVVAAAIWAVGLAIGASEALTGNAVVAIVALAVAVVPPWFEPAWVSHSRTRAASIARAAPHGKPPIELPKGVNCRGRNFWAVRV